MTHVISHRGSMTPADYAARGLAFFSFALGATQIAFPNTVCKVLGLEKNSNLMRFYGMREIASGIGAMQPNPAPAVWARVAGDAVDLGTLALLRRDSRGFRAASVRHAALAVVAIAAIDIAVAVALTAQQSRRAPPRDYSDRTGFPGGVEAARGAALRGRGRLSNGIAQREESVEGRA